MVTACKNGISVRIPKSAFVAMYAPNGWVEQKSEKKNINVVENSVEEVVNYENEISNSELTNQLAEMDAKQMKAFAREHGIDYSGVNSKSDLRDLIISTLSE